MPDQTLAQWLDYISSVHPAEIELGLDRIKRVYNKLNLCASTPRIVLVAGTNGKGSTIAMLETSLLALGYNVGSYTSPHILDYNERVRLNGIPVDDTKLIMAFEHVEHVRQDTVLTYFEFGTLAAFDILLSAQPDVVLLEIGLGGRLDAVNIVEPDLCIITSIGLDHTDWLGDSLDKIGYEKAGILRKHCVFVAGEAMPDSVLKQAELLDCQTYMCRRDFDKKADSILISSGESKLLIEAYPQVLLPENNILLSLQALCLLFDMLENTRGAFQAQHAHLAIQAINQLKLPGRLQSVSLSDLDPSHEIFLDVGHNPHAAVYLKQFLMHHSQQGKTIQLVYSSLEDKDVQSIARTLAPLADKWLIAPLDTSRAMSLDDLENIVSGCAVSEVEKFSSVNDAIQFALLQPTLSGNQSSRYLTLIFGSFYMVEAATRFFKRYE